MHSPFPRTFLEGIFGDLFDLRRRSHFDGIDVRKMGSLQNRFDLREEKKVTRSGEYGGIPKLQCFFLRETDKYSGLCEQERYRDGASMCGLPKSPLVTHWSYEALKNIFIDGLVPVWPWGRDLKWKEILRKISAWQEAEPLGSPRMGRGSKIPENGLQECFESWKRRMHQCFKWKGITLKKFALVYLNIFQ